MSLKKFLASALAAMCAASLLVPAAYAHGCHRRSAAGTQRTGCAVCTVENCTLTGRHVHGRTAYCGFDHADGWCDGFCVPLCSVKNCAATGLHSHSGAVCCGSDHEDGFCDGTCPVYQPVSSRGHHGGCHGARR